MSGALPRPGPGSMKQGGGVNYLCLPNQPTYGTYVPGRNERRTYIDAVIYGSSFRKPYNLANKIIHCSVCEVRKKSQTLMIPGSTRCKPGWTLEYTGFVATDGVGRERTEDVCLDVASRNSSSVSHMRGTVGSLDVVSVKCMDGILQCGGVGQYKEDTSLSCVVCSR